MFDNGYHDDHGINWSKKEVDSFIERVGIKNELKHERGIKIGWRHHNGDLIICLREADE